MGIVADFLVTNIQELVTCRGPETPRRGGAQSDLSIIENGAVASYDGRIVFVGTTEEAKRIELVEDGFFLDATGKTVTPGLIDAHTHVVFGGTREREFELRLQGASYLEIQENGGGIHASVEATKAATLRDLIETAKGYLDEMLAHGTTTVEAKSGYGLDLDTEWKQLEAIRFADAQHPVDLIPTFLGAHAIPPNRDPDEYTDWLCEEVIPPVGLKNLARFCDVFCEKGNFNPQQTEKILTTAATYGMIGKIHADELTDLGGAALAARVGAISADHLLMANKNGLREMAQAGCVAVLMPGTPLFLGMQEQADARSMIAMGLPVALGTDFNPGSCFVLSMPLVMSFACTRLKLTAAEALVAATVNAAWAVGEGRDRGVLDVGKRADLVVWNVPNYRQIPYRMGVNTVDTVIKDGFVVHDKNDKSDKSKDQATNLESGATWLN